LLTVNYQTLPQKLLLWICNYGSEQLVGGAPNVTHNTKDIMYEENYAANSKTNW